MDPIRVVIADDDAGMRLIERKLVEQVSGFELVGEAENGADALALVERLRPQLVFLDVDMPEKNGIECAMAIQDLDPSIVLIFATAFEDYREQAFSVYAFDYLVKPFKADRVIQTLTRVRDQLQGAAASTPLRLQPRPSAVAGQRLMLRHREGVVFLDQQDILLVQREDRATVVYALEQGEGGKSEQRRYVISESLSELEARLNPDILFRCHKSYIVNLGRIREITPYGRWTFVVRLEGTRLDALITHEKYEQLQKMFGG